MEKDVNNFTLKGLFASYCVKNLQTSGVLRTPEQSVGEQKEHNLFVSASEKIRNGSMQMQRYYRMLYVFENLVREFINNTFIETDRDEWFNARANRDMKDKLKKRKATEKKNQWHTGRNEHPLSYMDFGDLSRLIINNWNVFDDHFPDQAWVTSRIKDTERTRNVIAHNNELSAEEGVRLEMHLRDWIKQIG